MRQPWKNAHPNSLIAHPNRVEEHFQQLTLAELHHLFTRKKRPMAPVVLPKNLGMLLLAIFLILFGILTATFLGVSFSHSGDILAVLAMVSGVLLLLGR